MMNHPVHKAVNYKSANSIHIDKTKLTKQCNIAMFLTER